MFDGISIIMILMLSEYEEFILTYVSLQLLGNHHSYAEILAEQGKADLQIICKGNDIFYDYYEVAIILCFVDI